MLKLSENVSVEEVKILIKKLKKDLDSLNKGKTSSRSVFLNHYLTSESVIENCRLQDENFKKRFKEEKQRAWDFLNDEVEIEKAGWNYTGGKKSVLEENRIKQLEWANKAYAHYDCEVWDTELDIENAILILKQGV